LKALISKFLRVQVVVAGYRLSSMAPCSPQAACLRPLALIYKWHPTNAIEITRSSNARVHNINIYNA